MDAEAKKAAEKSEKNAAKMAAMQVRFQMMAKQQKDAAASLALAMKAKSPQENNKKQMALKLLEAKRQQAEAAKPAPIVAPTVALSAGAPVVPLTSDQLTRPHVAKTVVFGSALGCKLLRASSEVPTYLTARTQ